MSTFKIFQIWGISDFGFSGLGAQATVKTSELWSYGLVETEIVMKGSRSPKRKRYFNCVWVCIYKHAYMYMGTQKRTLDRLLLHTLIFPLKEVSGWTQTFCFDWVGWPAKFWDLPVSGSQRKMGRVQDKGGSAYIVLNPNFQRLQLQRFWVKPRHRIVYKLSHLETRATGVFCAAPGCPWFFVDSSMRLSGSQYLI